MSDENITASQEKPNPSSPQVRWDTSDLKSSYANVCNVSSTREEMILNFGINHSWDRTLKDIEIQLSHRIILSPFAAKRLSEILSKVVADYESKHGVLKG